MNKRILLIGGNFFPEPTGIGKYNGEMIQWFARNGWDCTVIATSPYYPYWKVQKPYSRFLFGKEVIQTEGKDIEVYRCPHYVPAKPSGMKRLLSEVSFSASAFLALLRVLGKKRFGYVLTVAPPFQLGYHALLYKWFRGAKFLYHIQDLQIDAARDLNMIKSKKFVSLLLRLEKGILKRADTVSSISRGMQAKIRQKTGGEVHFLPNWVDTETFYPMKNKAGLKERFGFSPNDKIVLYSGAMGEKQGLELMLHSAKALAYIKELRFVICGSGPYRQNLEKKAVAEGLHNVHFFSLQSQECFNAFLNAADLHLVLQKCNVGDVMMPSKLTTILAVGGLALITAGPGTGLYETVRENKVGVLVAPEDEQKFTSALLNCLQKDFSKIRENARSYAVESLCIDRILSRYEAQMAALQPPAFHPVPATAVKVKSIGQL